MKPSYSTRPSVNGLAAFSDSQHARHATCEELDEVHRVAGFIEDSVFADANQLKVRGQPLVLIARQGSK
jgi:hypothetical protein